MKSFERTKAGQPENKLKHHIGRQLHVARRLELASANAVKAKIEDEHQAIFRESVAARQSRKAALSELKETVTVHQGPIDRQL